MERPDNGFAHMVFWRQLPKTHPVSKCQPGTGNDTGEVSSSGHPTITQHDVGDGSIPTPAMTKAPARALSFRSWQKPSDSSPSERPASDRSAAGEQKNDVQKVLTATEPPSGAMTS